MLCTCIAATQIRSCLKGAFRAQQVKLWESVGIQNIMLVCFTLSGCCLQTMINLSSKTPVTGQRDKTECFGTFRRQLVLLQAAVDLHTDPVTGMCWRRRAVVCNDGDDNGQRGGPRPDCAET
jgi:hypothetical protein